ncbi:MAG: ComEC/Rec2 family competence protein [Hyphomicrobiales bacterium]
MPKDDHSDRIGLRYDRTFRALTWFRNAVNAQAEGWFLWLPASLGGGILFYFNLTYEPSWSGVISLAGLAVVITVFAARRGHFSAGLLVACALFGVVVAKGRTASLATPTLASPISVTLTGRVLSVEGLHGKVWRLTVMADDIAGPDDRERPRLVRIIAHTQGPRLVPGDYIRARARLLPPPGPVLPRGYDFARTAWFDGLGATGFAYGAPQKADGPDENLLTALQTGLGRWRIVIADHVRGILPGPSGDFAVALLTGERYGMPDAMVSDLRASGLAHLLAISGLHMTLVAGGVFWLARALLALSRGLALRKPIKKWAALAALAAAAGYLALSGLAIASQRAFIMLAIPFTAILLDRRAISMRNLALAALIILLPRPESLLQPGFQMSFTAVMALIACYDGLLRQRQGRIAPFDAGVIRRFWRISMLYGSGVIVTTLIAGLATAPLAAYHFQRIAAYSLLANAAALPLMGLVVMPFLLFALVLMPLGLEGWCLRLAGRGLDEVTVIAHKVAGLPGALHLVPAFPGVVAALVLSGMIWLCLWRETGRIIGVLPIMLGVVLALTSQRPDVLIGRKARIVAMRNAAGLLALTTSRSEHYTARQWLRADGDAASPDIAAVRSGFSCDELACSAILPDGQSLVVLKSTEALAKYCLRADIVVAQFDLMRKCDSAKIVIDARTLRENGAYALYARPDGHISVETANRIRGSRPWVKGGKRQSPR